MKSRERRPTIEPSTADERVEVWLKEAKAGNDQSLANLRAWVYATASVYFRHRAASERSVTQYDAEEMASSFFIEFDTAWPRVRSATKYTRFLLSSWVARYMKAKRQRQCRESPISNDVAGDDATERPWRSWDDAAWAQYQAVLQTFANLDPCTRSVVIGRLQTPPRPYRELSSELLATETSLRMRMSRFFRSVRAAYEDSTSNSSEPTSKLPPLRQIPRIDDVIRGASDGKNDSK